MSIFPDYINPNGQETVQQTNLYEILDLLGYRKHQITNSLVLAIRQDLWPFELTRVAVIRAELIELDAQIKDALADSAVSKTCNSEMSWATHIKMLRQQAHSLLEELARLYDVQIAVSKYAATGSGVRAFIQYQ